VNKEEKKARAKILRKQRTDWLEEKGIVKAERKQPSQPAKISSRSEYRRGGAPNFHIGDEVLVQGDKVSRKYQGLVGQVVSRNTKSRHQDIGGYDIYFPELDEVKRGINPSGFILVSGVQEARFPDTQRHIAIRAASELAEETLGSGYPSEAKIAYMREIASKFSDRDLKLMVDEEEASTRWSRSSSRPGMDTAERLYGGKGKEFDYGRYLVEEELVRRGGQL